MVDGSHSYVNNNLGCIVAKCKATVPTPESYDGIFVSAINLQLSAPEYDQ